MLFVKLDKIILTFSRLIYAAPPYVALLLFNLELDNIPSIPFQYIAPPYIAVLLLNSAPSIKPLAITIFIAPPYFAVLLL